MKIRVLIVDDEQAIVDNLERHFRYLGYEAKGISDPHQAIEVIKTENYHVVISDIRMPDMNGTELLKEIKEYNGAISVIMITGFVTMDNVMTCMRLGAQTCIFKPIEDLKVLEDAVGEAVNKLNMWQGIFKEVAGYKELGTPF